MAVNLKFYLVLLSIASNFMFHSEGRETYTAAVYEHQPVNSIEECIPAGKVDKNDVMFHKYLQIFLDSMQQSQGQGNLKGQP